MNKPKMYYFEEEEADSVELSPNNTAELNVKGEVIGIEILSAGTFVRDTPIEGVQAKFLNLTGPSSGAES